MTTIGAGSAEAGILLHVPYGHIPNSLLDEPNSTRMPDLETFFDFGGTLELVVVAEDSTRAKRDIVISEIMWAVDRGIDNIPGTSGILVPNPITTQTFPMTVSAYESSNDKHNSSAAPEPRDTVD